MTARPRVAVVGDVLLDRDVEGTVTRFAPDAPVPVVDVTRVRLSPGGAGLAALLCARDADVVLVAPFADDEAGRELRDRLAGVTLVPLGHAGPTRRKSRVRSGGQSLVRVDDGGPGTPAGLTPRDVERVRAALAGCAAVLVADYGGGVTRDLVLRHVLREAARHVPLVWDPHPRGGRPVPGAALVTPNLAEAAQAARELPGPVVGDDSGAPAVAEVLRDAWDAQAVAVTAGERGAYVALRADDATLDGVPVRHVAADPVGGTDPCGAGDRFAATVTERLARGDDAVAAVREGVRAASAWVAAGGAAAFRETAAADVGATDRSADRAEGPLREGLPETLEQLGARLRAGGTLVATSGCFDLLHAGHVSLLDGARGLGDHLVVLVNSDRSVRRLKGPERPVVPLEDRLRVLAGLGSVDAAIVLEDDDPSSAIAALRPDVWVKGGDYAVSELPEAPVVRSWGGRVVTLPYLDGRSTTGLVRQLRQPRQLHQARADDGLRPVPFAARAAGPAPHRTGPTDRTTLRRTS